MRYFSGSKVIFAVAAIAVGAPSGPLLAAHGYLADWSPNQPSTIGTTQLQPGQYKLEAEEGKSELEVRKGDKLIATVPIHWATLPTKALSSEVETDSGKVTQVKFEGQTKSVEINQ